MIMCTVCECFNHVTISPKYVSTLWTRQADPDSAQAASKLLRRSEDLQDGLDRGSCHTGLIPYDNNMSTLRLSYRALGRVEEGTGGLTGELPSQIYQLYFSLSDLTYSRSRFASREDRGSRGELSAAVRCENNLEIRILTFG